MNKKLELMKMIPGEEVFFQSHYLKGLELKRRVSAVKSNSVCLTSYKKGSKNSWIYFDSQHMDSFQYKDWLVFVDKKDLNDKNIKLISHVIEEGLNSIVPFLAYKKA